MSGGAIPDNADYDVVLEPQGSPVGTVNEDFAIESMAGDIFQLGISSWRILRVEPGKVRVEDARGLPPSIPFWLGEAPARTNELSQAVSWLREEVGRRVGGDEASLAQATAWLKEEAGIDLAAAEQAVEYIAAGKAALGVVPTQETLVLERFFDDTGGMQLVLHSPFGGRVNRAWGLALRKRFCRTFNFELQAAATEDAIALSLGMQHSFPLEEVFTYLHPATARDVLVQAVLAAPVFQTRWRWSVSRALAVLRMRSGKRVPMPIQRMRSDDLLASIFPAQMACQENLPPDVEPPDHPLVQQVLRDCLEEAMDADGFLDVLQRIIEKRVALVAKDTVEPSPFAYEILNARPYAFLDDAPLEERRTQAVSMRRSLDVDSARDLGRLDVDAIERVREQAWPEPEDPDELHDALMLAGFLTASEMVPWRNMLGDLLAQGRATRLTPRPAPAPSPSSEKGPGSEAASGLWIAAERLPMLQAALPDASNEPAVRVPEREAAVRWTHEDALRETVRARLECLGLGHHGFAGRLRRRRRIGHRSCLGRPRDGGGRPAAAISPAPPPRSGATAVSSPVSTATPWTACAQRSNLCRRPISCGSCSPGTTSPPTPVSKGLRPLSPSSTSWKGSKCRFRRGKVTPCPPASAATTHPGWTSSACRENWRGRGSTRPARPSPRTATAAVAGTAANRAPRGHPQLRWCSGKTCPHTSHWQAAPRTPSSRAQPQISWTPYSSKALHSCRTLPGAPAGCPARWKRVSASWSPAAS